jgi:type V secretory pathway adhesin AidA
LQQRPYPSGGGSSGGGSKGGGGKPSSNDDGYDPVKDNTPTPTIDPDKPADINAMYADVRNIYNKYANKADRDEAIAEYLLRMESYGVSQDITNLIAKNYGIELPEK